MRQESILRHSSSNLPDSGYMVRVVEDDVASASRVRYSHRDDYYMIGMIVSGNLDCRIDFQSYAVSRPSIIILTPGQVHQFVVENDITGCVLAVDPRLLDEKLLHRLDQLRSFHSPVYEAEDYADFAALCRLISRQKNTSVGINLVKAAVEIIIDSITSRTPTAESLTDRRHQLMLGFRELLNENITKQRRPGFYASLLNISTVYLNEIVQFVAGQSASDYIKNEIILLAKRELFYTSDSIKEISHRLGFTDNAYFSRLFTETVGMSPNAFRRNLDKSN